MNKLKWFVKIFQHALFKKHFFVLDYKDDEYCVICGCSPNLPSLEDFRNVIIETYSKYMNKDNEKV